MIVRHLKYFGVGLYALLLMAGVAAASVAVGLFVVGIVSYVYTHGIMWALVPIILILVTWGLGFIICEMVDSA